MAGEARQLLRHTVATVAYRAAKALHTLPEESQDLKVSPTTRTPVEIVAHLGDLFDWALSMANGENRWHSSQPLPWHDEVDRFHAAVGKFDAYLASQAPLHAREERLFQGPVADALSHVGQIAMLCRMAGTPVRGENYFKAEITAGRVGADQAKPVGEFD